MNYPFDDEDMTYDYKHHRYYLTQQCVLNELNINLGEGLTEPSAERQQEVLNLLKEISNTVYREIYKCTNQKRVVEYLLAKCPSAREIIKEALLEQVRYFDFNGIVEIYAGVDFKKGTKSVDFSDRILAPMAKNVLSEELVETGTPVLYSGKYIVYSLSKLNYTEQNY